MDDGSKLGNGFKISTHSYTKEEVPGGRNGHPAPPVELLIKTLKLNFNINSSIHNFDKEQFTLYIKSDSMVKFKNLVLPYFHYSMLYKLK